MSSDVSTTGLEDALSRKVRQLEAELAEARGREAATAEILRVIAGSPTDVQPVFETIIANAMLLCDASLGTVGLRDGKHYRHVAQRGGSAEYAEWLFRGPFEPNPAYSIGLMIAEQRPVHHPDYKAIPEYQAGDPRAVATAALGEARTYLAVPMLKQGRVIGGITIRRTEVRPFTQRQIDLLSAFADQAVIAIENTRLFEAEQARTKELRESLEYQTATSDVLNVISRSKFDLQPVLDTIANAAARLCGGVMAGVFRYDGKLMHLGAMVNFGPEGEDITRQNFPRVPTTDTAAGKAIVEGAVVVVPDVQRDRRGDWARELAQTGGYRSAMAAPMLREGVPVGAIVVARVEAGPFPEAQVEVLKTFADQAVIAIENTRLFEAEQASKRELQQSLEYQTATSEVLSVISRSPAEVQPVLDTIAETSQRLCGADRSSVWRLVDRAFELVAISDYSPAVADYMTSVPVPADRTSLAGRCVLEKRTLHVHDRLNEPDLPPLPQSYASGARTLLCVPLLREGQPIGVVRLSRDNVAPFTTRQIELVETFADQAVIAIENTRLFEEVQARTAELQESLEYQTATSEVLGVISRSPSEFQPALDAIASIASRLCAADDTSIRLKEGGDLRNAAHHGSIPIKLNLKRPIGRDFVAGRTVVDRKPVHVHDLAAAGDEFPLGRDIALEEGHRTTLGIPLLRGDQAIGCLVVRRTEVRPFSDKHIAVLKTFADQAVIAIENTRLFEAEQASKRELQVLLDQQTATSDILRVISSSVTNIQPVFDTISANALRLCVANFSAVLLFDGEVITLASSHNLSDPSAMDAFRKAFPRRPRSGGATDQAILTKSLFHIPDVSADLDYPHAGLAAATGYRSILSVPLLREGHPVGAITVAASPPDAFSEQQIELLQTFADQAVIAIENTRLFEEVKARTHELATTIEKLEIASQHKSQFVANMSHELRTPLAAILGYAELMQEGFYGTPTDKSMDALTRIKSNGKHLLGLINTVLDIAKIESGQFSLNLGEYAIESVVETVRAATESLAETKKLSLKTDVAKKLPVGLGDEQRLTQVLLNLVGNAIKFTDTGEVRITATAMNGHFTVAVADTGPGIPPEELKRVFEQFHQIDNSNTKAKGGTGLGLAIAKQIVEMHGGRIWVESTLGKGATFQIELPVRAEDRKGAA